MGMSLGILLFAYFQREESLFDVDLSKYTAKAWLYIYFQGTGFTWFSTDEKSANLMQAYGDAIYLWLSNWNCQYGQMSWIPDIQGSQFFRPLRTFLVD